MLTKKKGDRLPDEYVKEFSPSRMTVQSWLDRRELWSNFPSVHVQVSDFVVDSETQRLYVGKQALAAAPHKWLHGNVRVERVHDGWLKAEIVEGIRFERGNVANNKVYSLINLLYGVRKLDDTIKEDWWNT